MHNDFRGEVSLRRHGLESELTRGSACIKPKSMFTFLS